MEREKTIYRSYPASGGRLYPFGNGCWDGLPQRQWSKEAFSGCKITHLEKTGFRISLDRIDGGTMGGSAKLQISYENVGSESVFCRVEYNDDAALVHFWEEDPTGGLLELPPTGGQFAKAECAVQLRPGDNRITLVLTSPAVPGLAVEAFTILPFDTNCQ